MKMITETLKKSKQKKEEKYQEDVQKKEGEFAEGFFTDRDCLRFKLIYEKVTILMIKGESIDLPFFVCNRWGFFFGLILSCLIVFCVML